MHPVVAQLHQQVERPQQPGHEEVEDEPGQRGQAQDAGHAAGQHGQRGAGEVQRLGVHHHVAGVQRLRLLTPGSETNRRGRGGLGHCS